MPRFFVLPENVNDHSLSILGDDARHIARSLRMAVGDELTVSDGVGTDYVCRLTRIRDERCDCEILTRAASDAEPAVAVTLFMAYPKGDKLETVIQKAVELGACRVVPFTSSRCVKRPSAERAEQILPRLNRIAKEAAKQCGRAILPSVSPTLSFSEMLREACRSDLALFCYEGARGSAKRSIKDALANAASVASVAVIVGSEGGFSPEEAAAAEGAGALPVGLGRRILRCETAPLFALSAVCYHCEL